MEQNNEKCQLIKIDPYTKESFIPKRKNQVYAKDLNRINYHNEASAILRIKKAPIDEILKRNYLILSKLVPKNISKTFNKEDLHLKGFNHNYFTHVELHEGDVCRCMYHFIFPKTDDTNSITIINNDND